MISEKKNYTGRGVTVAILDTGVFARHPDLKGRIKVFCDFVRGKREAYDDNSHGTHVAGIICSSGSLSDGYVRGVAPSADLAVLKVLDAYGNGKTFQMLRGIDWILKNYKKYGIRIVNISVGALPEKGEGEQSALVRAVNRLWDTGLVVCVAAGNEGKKKEDWSSITVPGISRKAITVGSSDDEEMIDNKSGKRLVHYSGRGPTADCICKPEIVAPGTNIISLNSYYASGGKPYSIKSGTSMSTPMVSGAIALLLEKYPWMTNTEVKLRLREKSDDLGLPMNHQGWGSLNIERLLED
ncbi:MAG: S8 family peptidase [Lachnospiraceae bacterium]